MSRDGLPTGEGTADKNDVADPHPATEDEHDNKRGSANSPKSADIGPNSYAHNGTAAPRGNRTKP